MPESRLRADLTPLRTSRDFRLLYASRTVIALGTQATEVALLVQAKQLTGCTVAVASVTSARFSLASGGLFCAGAVGLVCLALPGFTRYRAQAAPRPRAAIINATGVVLLSLAAYRSGRTRPVRAWLPARPPALDEKEARRQQWCCGGGPEQCRVSPP